MVINEIDHRFDSQEEKRMYWDGFMNYCMRLFYYLLQGCAVYNEVRNYVIIVVLAYLAIKINNYAILAFMFSVSTPLTIWIGHFKTHKMAKNHEWLQVHFATKYSKESIQLQRETLKAIQKLNERLENGHSIKSHSNIDS